MGRTSMRRAGMARLRSLIALVFAAVILIPATAALAGEVYTVIHNVQLKGMVDADKRDFLLVDARNPEEYRESHISGAVNIPQKRFDKYAGILPADKSAKIVFYCNGVKCGKSKRAALQASKLGYENIIVFAEGMPVWEEKGYEFYKSAGYEERIETTKLLPKDLQALMAANPDKVVVVDVRDPEEYGEGHMPGAINIPLARFAEGSGALDKKKRVVVYCNSGGRSYGAYRKLMRLGYKDIAQAIFADWKDQGLPVAY